MPNFCTFSTWRAEIRHAGFQRLEVLGLEILLLDPAVHLERPDGGDQDGAIGRDAGLAALDVEELLAAEIGAEARFRHHVVAELERGRGRQDRVAAMRDIRERAAMHEGRRAFERLHQVGGERLLEQRRHRALRLEVGGVHRLPVARIATTMLPSRFLRSSEVAGEAEDRHHLRGGPDVEAVLARKSIGDAAERGDDLAQRPVVHVEHAPPSHPPLVDGERIAPVDVIVDHGGEQIVGRRDGVEVAGEMQVDVFHRHDLGIAAAGRRRLHAERGPSEGSRRQSIAFLPI